MLDTARRFADDLSDVITGSLPGSPQVRAVQSVDRILITALESAESLTPARMPLFCDGNHLASWTMSAYAEQTATIACVNTKVRTHVART